MQLREKPLAWDIRIGIRRNYKHVMPCLRANDISPIFEMVRIERVVTRNVTQRFSSSM
jgi:hypothetical protein